MMRLNGLKNSAKILFLGWIALLFYGFSPIDSNTIKPELLAPEIIENSAIAVSVSPSSGCFTVLEKESGQMWQEDPWENAAGLLTLLDAQGIEQTINISKSKTIEVVKINNSHISIRFIDPVFDDKSIAEGVVILTSLRLSENLTRLDVEVEELSSGKHTLLTLRYPSRAFSLETDVDKGAAVIPQKQGVICPSYIFPMNGGAFCVWDDATYNHNSIGKLELYTNGTGLSMPWWGTYNQKSAVIGILDESAIAQMFYNINNNGQYLFTAEGKMSVYNRIEFLDPIWNLNLENERKRISYHFIPNGDYVDMAKVYRKEAIERGYFVSLKEKAQRNPNVNKLQGAIYMGLYGGYPHYVHMPDMAFSFDQLKDIINTTHEELKVDNAFFHAWGVFSNFAPNCSPISEELGGAEKLREAVDLTKEYDYLYSSYHAYSPMLENDPDFTDDLMMRDENGKLKNTNSRWARVDPDKQLGLARNSIENEIEALDLEADITDITFARYYGEGNDGRLDLAKYIDSLNLVNGTEHGQQQWIPYFDMFEGMTYLRSNNLSRISHRAPLFNLVYHDAIAVFGKIQDPDNQISENGDFRVKSLRNILFGLGTTIFFSPYEFDGMKEMIKMANTLVSPVHRETFFSELLSHEYLTKDFKVQRTRFSSDTEVIVNLGPVQQTTADGLMVPAFGYQITFADGRVEKGSFQVSLVN